MHSAKCHRQGKKTESHFYRALGNPGAFLMPKIKKLGGESDEVQEKTGDGGSLPPD